MLNCPNCGKELVEGTAFCDNCGAAIPVAAETVFCANCGAQTDAGSEFCQNCGAALAAEKAAPAKKFPIKWAVIGGIAVVAIALIVVLISAIFGGSKKDVALYMKDGEMWFSDFTKNGKFELTKSYFDDEDKYNNEKGYAILSSDNKTLFYPDKINIDGYTLYYKDISKEKNEAVKIDSDVTSYQPNEKGTLVTYEKNGDLYQYNMKKDEKEKVAKEVDEYRVSDDGKIIYYIDVEGDLYVKQAKKDKVKMASDVWSIDGVSKNFKTIYYRTYELIEEKDEEGVVINSYNEYDLYTQKLGKDKQKIESDVDSVKFIAKKEVLYFVTVETKKVAASTFVNDDVKGDEDYANYEEAIDELRSALKSEKVEIESKTLNYFDGKKVTKVVEDFAGYETSATDVAVLLVTSGGTYEKMDLSHLIWYDAETIVERVAEFVEYAAKEDMTYSVISGTDMATLEIEEIYNATMSEDGKLLYLITNVETERVAEDQEGVEEGEDPRMENIPYNERVGDLVQVKIGKKAKLTVDDKYDSEIAIAAQHGFYGEDDDVFVYGKDYDTEKGYYDLYMDQKQIDSDAVAVLGYAKKILYYATELKKDEDTGSMEGFTLKAYKGKKVYTLSEDVYNYQILPSGEVLYLYDYNTEKGEGELYKVKVGKKGEKIDEDVSSLVNFYYLVDVYKD